MGVTHISQHTKQSTTITIRMDSLKGAKLVKADGSSVEADSALEGKDLILFYFSAHWCPPCRQFTPMLKDFYDEVDNVEIVFVSSDRSNDDMLSYMKESHGDWLATEHGSPLVVVKPDGTLVTKDGRAHVCSKQPKQAVEG